AACVFGPLDAPELLTGVLIEAAEEGTALRIARHEQNISSKHRRSAHSKRIIERAHRRFPTLIAIEAIGGEAVVGEEDVHVLAVAHGAWRSRRIVDVQFLLARPRRFPAPQDFARFAIEADREQLLVFKSSEE